MPKITIDWRVEENSTLGYIRVEAGGAPTTEIRAFEIREAQPRYFSVYTLHDGIALGTSWKSLATAKVIAITKIFEAIATQFGQPPAHYCERGLRRKQLG